MDKKETGSLGCLGTAQVAAVVTMVILKLAGVISWSWWIVFSPFLIEIAILFALLVVLAIALGLREAGR